MEYFILCGCWFCRWVSGGCEVTDYSHKNQGGTAASPSLACPMSGAILFYKRYRFSGMRQMICIFFDVGKEWDYERQISENHGTGNCPD